MSSDDEWEFVTAPGVEKTTWVTELNFWINGEAVKITNPDPRMTLLDWMREQRGLTSVHVGCGEGGCGICTVALSRAGVGGSTDTISINSCLRRLCAVDGCHVITTAGLGSKKTGFHAIQTAIADGNGSQCGFCTPGWVMQMYSLLAKNVEAQQCTRSGTTTSDREGAASEVEGGQPSAKAVEEHFDGMLCRCTGYRPILTAFGKFAAPPGGTCGSGEAGAGSRCGKGAFRVADPPSMKQSRPAPLHFTNNEEGTEYFRPTTMAELEEAVSAAAARGRRVRLWCAGTGQGVSKYYGGPEVQGEGEEGTALVEVSVVPEMGGVAVGKGSAEFGAAVSIARAGEALAGDGDSEGSGFGELARHMGRVASAQVREVGSWAGNLMLARQHPAFPSDLATILAAAGASVRFAPLDAASLRSEAEGAAGGRIGKSRSASVPELLSTKGCILLLSLSIPRLPPSSLFRTFKAAQRSAFAYAIVNFGACFTFDATGSLPRVASACIVVGGASDRLLVASRTAAATLRKPLDQAAFSAAAAALAHELAASPSSDPRASPQYRSDLAISFLYKTFLAAQSSLPSAFRSALQPFVSAAARPVSRGTEDFGTDGGEAPVSRYIPKLQARAQASGEVRYPSDHGIGYLAAQPVLSRCGGRRLAALGFAAAMAEPGAVAGVRAEDVPGVNCPNAVLGGENLKEKLFWAEGDEVPHVGAMLGVVVATSWAAARRAAARVRQTWAEAEGGGGQEGGAAGEGGGGSGTGGEARAGGRRRLRKDMAEAVARGDTQGVGVEEVAAAVRASRRRAGGRAEWMAGVGVRGAAGAEEGGGAELRTMKGRFGTGGQMHLYMETQSACAAPVDGDRWEVVSSCQDARMNQACLAAVLGVREQQINVRVPRAGGGFGGKLTRQLLVSCAAAVAAQKVQRGVRVQLERGDDMRMVVGREPMGFAYEVKCSDEGRVESLAMEMTIDPGWFLGDNGDTLAMAVHFSDNVYSYPGGFAVTTQSVATATPHSTAMRAPGCMQSILASEVVMEHVARSVGKSLHEVQELNFYDLSKGPVVTPFGDHLGEDGFNWTIPQLWAKVQTDAQFAERRAAVEEFNAANRYTKRGIAMSPAKYVMGLQHFSSGALVNVYADGSVLVTTGGSEIGQGLETKVALCVAEALGVPLETVGVGQRETATVPNNTATGGSGTSESSSQAAMVACAELNKRLAPYRAGAASFAEAVKAAVAAGVSLMASGWFKPEQEGRSPHTYATYGAACSEVRVDVLTGEVRVERVDLCLDLGTQLDAAVDIGQLQGGFVMSLGYLLTEERRVDADGEQLHVGTWHYKIPSAYDIPLEFNVSLLKDTPNPRGILGSKASAEPAMTLVASAYHAVKQAVYAARADMGHTEWFELNTPLTPQCIRAAVGVQDMTVPASSQ